MLTRIAIYEGTIKAGKEEEFFHQVETRLEPIWRQFPHVTEVRVFRRTKADSDARPIPMILEMDFPSMQAIEDCLNSDIRPKAHEATLEVMKMFEGRFYHLVTEKRDMPPAG